MCAKLSLFLAIVAGASACGADDWHAADSDPSLLVGMWREIPYNSETSTIPLDQRAVATFGSDGSYSYDDKEGDPIEMETYTADPSWLTLTGADSETGTSTMRQPYVATSANLMVGPMYPSSSVNGVLGSWHGESALSTGTGGSGTLTVDFDVRSDGTATIHTTGLGEDDSHDGTWQMDGTDVVFTYLTDSQGDSVILIMQQFPGVAALGGQLFERP